MSINAKIINEILANPIQEHIKNITHHDQIGFIPEIKGKFSICKSVDIIHDMNGLKNQNSIVILIDEEKTFDRIHHPFSPIIFLTDEEKNLTKSNIHSQP